MIEEIKITSLAGRGSVSMKTQDYVGYWLDRMSDLGHVSGDHQTYSYANQIGEDIVSTTIGPRQIAIKGWVVEAGYSTLQERCDFLNAFICPNEDYELEAKGKKIRFRPDSSIIYGDDEISNNRFKRKFLIQATCPYPLFSDLEDTAVPFDFEDKNFIFPTAWGQDEENPVIFAKTEKAFSAEIDNSGGFETSITCEIVFTGEVVNPRIKNITTGKYTGVTHTFVTGDKLQFSTAPGSKYIRKVAEGGIVTNLIKYRDYGMSWIMLEPGKNLLSADCDNLGQRGNMNVTVYYSRLYMEVR